jgi:hypothetical protein
LVFGVEDVSVYGVYVFLVFACDKTKAVGGKVGGIEVWRKTVYTLLKVVLECQRLRK